MRETDLEAGLAICTARGFGSRVRFPALCGRRDTRVQTGNGVSSGYLIRGGIASCRDLIIGSVEIEIVGTVNGRISTMSHLTTITILTAFCDPPGATPKQ